MQTLLLFCYFSGDSFVSNVEKNARSSSQFSFVMSYFVLVWTWMELKVDFRVLEIHCSAKREHIIRHATIYIWVKVFFSFQSFFSFFKRTWILHWMQKGVASFLFKYYNVICRKGLGNLLLSNFVKSLLCTIVDKLK